MLNRIRMITAALAVPAVAVLTFGAAPASATAKPAVKPYTVTASTSVANHPDSGGHGYWALDKFSRTISISLKAEVPLSNCGAATDTGHCYQWTGTVTDAGTFTTTIGKVSPGNGGLNGGTPPVIGAAVTGSMNGSGTYAFYASWKLAQPKYLPATWDDHGNVPTGHHTTGSWYRLFFGDKAVFSGPGLTQWKWVYVAPAGADKACPLVSSEWIDQLANTTAAANGNILAPDAAHC